MNTPGVNEQESKTLPESMFTTLVFLEGTARSEDVNKSFILLKNPSI